MLFIVAVACIAVFFSAHVAGQDICPVTTRQCYCEISYGTIESLYCDNLGSVANVPAFQSSSRVFTQLAIRYDSAIDTVQDNAFAGLQLNSLSLQNLRIRLVEEYAFQGLGGSLQELKLEKNQLESFPVSCLRNLTRLRYVGLNNNILTSISGGMFATLGQLSALYLSYNEIETLGVDSFLGLGTLYDLYLKQNRLSRLTPGVLDPLTGLSTLDLSYNRLSSNISSGVLSVLVNLQRLMLSNNQLTALDGLLTGLQQLTSLDVSCNNMVSIPSGQFDDSAKLTSINMSVNSISSIAERAFANATRLQNLYIDNNRLTTIDASIFANMSGLRNLGLAQNAITDIASGSFAGMSNLGNLYLSGNGLEAVGKGWFDGLSKLQTLDLSSNRINTIDVLAFAGLSTLKTLNLQNNNLVTLMPQIFRPLQSLNTLNVYRNVISFLDENAFSFLTGLRYLHLEYNNISQVPSLLFHGNPSLETVGLSYNRISVIGSNAYPIRIKYLYLDNNRITEIPRYAFPDGMQLVILNLSSNFIDTVYQESLSRFSGLWTLALDDNSLSDLPDYMLRNDYNLITLSLSHNRLRNITSSTVFQGLTKATIIELDNNQIRTVAQESVAHLMGLNQLDLSNNPIQCDCVVDWMRGYAPLVGLMDTVCSSPAPNSGQLVVCFNQSVVCATRTTPLNSTASLCNNIGIMTTKTSPSTTTRTTTTTKPATTKTTTTSVKTQTQMTSSATKTFIELTSTRPTTKISMELFSVTSATKSSPEISSTTLASRTSAKMLPPAQTTKTIVELSSAANSMPTEFLSAVPASNSSSVTSSIIPTTQSSTVKLPTSAASEVLTKLKTVRISTATPPVTSAIMLTERLTKLAISTAGMQTKTLSPVSSTLKALPETQQSTEVFTTQSETLKSTSETLRATGQSIQDTTSVLITSKSEITGKHGNQKTTSRAGIILSSVTNTPAATSQPLSLGSSVYPETPSSSSSASVSEESSRSDTHIPTESIWSLPSRLTHQPNPYNSTLSRSYVTPINQSTPYFLSTSLYPSNESSSNLDGVIELKLFPDELSITVLWNVSTSHKIVGLRILYRYVNSDQNLGSDSIQPSENKYIITGLPLTPGLEFAVCLECTLSVSGSRVSTAQKCEVTRLAAPSTESPIRDNSSNRTLIIEIVIPILVVIAVVLLIFVVCRLRVARSRKAGHRSLQQMDSEDGKETHRAQGSQKVLLTDHAKLQSLKHAPATGTQGIQSTSNRPRSARLAPTQKTATKPLIVVTYENPIYPTFPHQGQSRNTQSSSNNTPSRTHSPASGNILNTEQQETFESSDNLVEVTQPQCLSTSELSLDGDVTDFGSTSKIVR